MWCCSAVSKNTPEMAAKRPSTNAAKPITSADWWSARNAMTGTMKSAPIGAAMSGRSRLMRRLIALPKMRPHAFAVMMSPHAAGPPSDRSAIRGPRTKKLPMPIALVIAYCAEMSQTQRRVRNSSQPSINSRANAFRAARTFGSTTRTARRRIALTKKLAASIAIASPGPNAATSTPPTAAPPIRAPFRERPSSALASLHAVPGRSAARSRSLQA